MIVVKITTLWDHNYYFQIPDFLTKLYKFEINNDCDKADYWFIWGGVRKKERVSVDKKNVFFIVEEAYDERKYKQSFLDQFQHVITCRPDITHNGLIRHHDLGIWYFKKSYTDLKNLEPLKKSKKVSVVCSDLTWLPGHKKRYAFVNQLMGHFKDKIDVYGKGFNFIEDKFDALYPYEYSIAIENNVVKDYFTEKIFECYLTYTVPVYYGCPNVTDYFSENSLLKIDINDLKSSIKTIEELVEGRSLYENYVPQLLVEREKVFNQYHLFSALHGIITKHGSSPVHPKFTTINMEFNDNSFIKKLVKKIIN